MSRNDPLPPCQTDPSAYPRSCRDIGGKLSDGPTTASIDDRARIWEVRKYCQVKPSLAQYDRNNVTRNTPSGALEFQADSALCALLRCLIYELDADLAMVSLLDDQRQYFVAGASRDRLTSAKVTLESTKWYGCDSVLHHDGLCERTVAMENLPAIYEELDLIANNRTKSLPFVNGDVARFRYYAGSPISTEQGLVIGTVFVFSEKPSSAGILQHQRQFLSDTSETVMRQLTQAVRALEGTRSVMFTSAVASLQNATTECLRAFDKDPHAIESSSNGRRQSEYVTRMYQQAAQLISGAFEVESCHFQEVGQFGKTSTPQLNNDLSLAGFSALDAEEPQNVAEATVASLVEAFPNGGVFHLSASSEDGVFLVAFGSVPSFLDEDTNAALRQTFPRAQQILFMPLWDSFHGRTVAATFGWSSTFDRVYAGNADLAQLSAFCTSTMAQIRRVEANVLVQRKSDFMGSISHEMRSPLHGILGSLDVLTDTRCTDEQIDLIQGARMGGTQLLDNIDKILQFTQISNPADEAYDKADAVSRRLSIHSKRINTDMDVSEGVELLSFCEDIVATVVQKTHTVDLLNARNAIDASPRTHPVIITLDALPEESGFRLTNHKGFGIVFENLVANALKYSGIDCCLRANLSIENENVKVKIEDCGRGMPASYLRDSLYVPFSQADPIDAGTGLGLPLAKRTIDSLKGTISIESSQDLGTSVNVSIPLSSLARGTDKVGRRCSARRLAGHIPCPLRAQLFVPPVWSSGVYGSRGDRLVENLYSSLKRTLEGWAPTDLVKWTSESEPADVIFVRQGDLDRFRSCCGEKYKGSRKILIGGDAPFHIGVIEKAADIGPGAAVEITGPLLPTKLWEGLNKIFAIPDASGSLDCSVASLTLEGGGASDATSDTAVSPSELGPSRPESEPSNWCQDPATVKSSEPTTSDITKIVEVPRIREDEPKEPRLLLVDDNAVNLKLLRMFASKCGIKDPVAVTGGQEAVSAYEKAVDEDQRFSVCFMDLSMPGVDGFEATAAIRKKEADSSTPERRMEIVALTGLVSGKDRNAAFAAGVDDYITKPAKVINIQEVIDRWKTARAIAAA